MSPLAENSGGLGTCQMLQQSDKKGHFKRGGNHQMFNVSSYAPMLKHEAEQQLSTWKQLLQETNKQPFMAH